VDWKKDRPQSTRAPGCTLTHGTNLAERARHVRSNGHPHFTSDMGDTQVEDSASRRSMCWCVAAYTSCRVSSAGAPSSVRRKQYDEDTLGIIFCKHFFCLLKLLKQNARRPGAED